MRQPSRRAKQRWWTHLGTPPLSKSQLSKHPEREIQWKLSMANCTAKNAIFRFIPILRLENCSSSCMPCDIQLAMALLRRKCRGGVKRIGRDRVGCGIDEGVRFLPVTITRELSTNANLRYFSFFTGSHADLRLCLCPFRGAQYLISAIRFVLYSGRPFI